MSLRKRRPRVEPAHAGGDSEEDSEKTSGSDDDESDTTAGGSEETKIKRAGRLFLLNYGLWVKGGSHIFEEALDPAYDEKKRFDTSANKIQGQLRDIKKVLPDGLEGVRKNGWIARMFLAGVNSQRSNTSTRVRKTAGASIFDCSPVDLLTAEARDKKFRDKIGWYVEDGSAGAYSSLDVAILHLDWKGEYDIDTCFLAPCLMRLYGALIRGATFATDMLELERKIQDGYDGPKIVLNVRGSETMERIFALDHTEPGAIAGSAVLAIWALSGDTELRDRGDRTNIDYDALFDQYLEILTVGLREKSRAILNVFKEWDTTLFPNSERVKKSGSGGNGGNQRALDALRADEKMVSDEDN
ncbi:hypothetical protein DFH06DRAFT_1352165 [Mycena polygramma]|nr:hypothetical protein DFH06DRAFT_1352165 [Mycena polygramma]